MTLIDQDGWRRLSPLLDELLDLDVAARRRRLVELSALDAALADELDAMLGAARRAEASRFLAGSALGTDLAAATLGRRPASKRRLLVGR